jgi:hypothetical protein
MCADIDSKVDWARLCVSRDMDAFTNCEVACRQCQYRGHCNLSRFQRGAVRMGLYVPSVLKRLGVRELVPPPFVPAAVQAGATPEACGRRRAPPAAGTKTSELQNCSTVKKRDFWLTPGRPGRSFVSSLTSHNTSYVYYCIYPSTTCRRFMGNLCGKTTKITPAAQIHQRRMRR